MKTIKRERQVRLDELLKYVFDNGKKRRAFKSDNDSWVKINEYGNLECVLDVSKTDLFTITEEIEINHENRLDLIVITESGKVENFENRSIQGVLCNCSSIGVEVKFIYLQQEDGKLGELIWKDGEMVD